MIALLFACASTLSPDSTDTSATTMPKMVEATCEMESTRFVVDVGDEAPPAAVIWLGATVEDAGSGELVTGWHTPTSISYQDGVLYAARTNETLCQAWVQ